MSSGKSAAFPKSARLRKRADFLRLTSDSHKFVIRGFLIVWCENDLRRARLGITASKKLGCAVVRNKIKRYLREIFRQNRLQMAAVDFNVIVRRESTQMSYEEIFRELGGALRHTGISPCLKAVCSF